MGKHGKGAVECGKNHTDLGEVPPPAVLTPHVASGGKISPAPDGAACSTRSQ